MEGWEKAALEGHLGNRNIHYYQYSYTLPIQNSQTHVSLINMNKLKLISLLFININHKLNSDSFFSVLPLRRSLNPSCPADLYIMWMRTSPWKTQKEEFNHRSQPSVWYESSSCVHLRKNVRKLYYMSMLLVWFCLICIDDLHVDWADCQFC